MNGNKQERKGRKLPHVERGKKNHGFWPTYRGAMEWMRKHKEIVDTAISLIEIYPNIIQDYSLDSFWCFIKPYLNSCTKGKRSQTVSDIPKKPKKISQKSTVFPKIISKVPLISITPNSDTEQDAALSVDAVKRQSKTPRVYICGYFDTKDGNEVASSFVDEMAALSYVCHNGINETYRQAVCEANTLVFIISDATLADSDCCQKLIRAWSLDTPVVYVRQAGYQLPRQLSETFTNQVMINQKSHGNMKISFCRQSVTPIDTRSFPPSVGPAITRSSQTDKPCIDMDDNFQTSFMSSNLVLNLVNGYKDSIVYDDKCPHTFIHMIESYLSKSANYSSPVSFQQQTNDHLTLSTSSQLFLDVPPSNGLNLASKSEYYRRSSITGISPSATEFLQTDIDSFPGTPSVTISRSPSPVLSLRVDPSSSSVTKSTSEASSSSSTQSSVPTIERDLDSGVHSCVEAETFYVIYPDQNSALAGESPKVVKWPPDEPEALVSLSPPENVFDSTLTFNDIDLTTEVNIDLFSPDNSINAD